MPFFQQRPGLKVSEKCRSNHLSFQVVAIHETYMLCVSMGSWALPFQHEFFIEIV